MRTFAIVVLASALAVGGCSRRGLANDVPDLGGVGAGDGADLGDADLGGGGGAPDLAGPPDMTPPPTLIPSDIKYYYGTTSDGWSVVVPGYYAAGPAWAFRLADGMARLIVDSQYDAWTSGDLVFVEYNVFGGNGKLAVWRQGGPAVVLHDQMLAIGPRPLSDGAGHIAYYVSGGSNAGVLCVDTVDHAGARCLAAPFADVAQNGLCTPKARLIGSRLLVQHCPWPVLTTSVRNVLSSYDLAGTADADLATDALFFDSAPNVGVLLTSRSGAVNLVAADGSGTLTTKPLATGAKSAIFTPDGSAALVVTTSNALERVDLASGAVTVLQASSVLGVSSVSNDGNFAIYTANADPMTARDDLWLSDARNAGTTPVTLDPTTTAYFTFGHGFTSDSAFAVYLADSNDEGFGSLRARSVAGGNERALGTGCLPATPVGGSRIVYSENADTTGVPTISDLSFVDLASSAAPTRIATRATAFYQVLSDGTLIYLQPGEGLHAVKLP